MGRSAGRGARGRAGAESLTGLCPGAGGRRLVLQEAHGHFQDIRLLQLRVAGALRPATRERDRKTDNQDSSPAGCLSPAILPGAGRPARNGPRRVGCPRPDPIGVLSWATRAEPPRRSLGRRHLGPPAHLAPRPRTPLPGPQRLGTHLPAQQRQDESLELLQALVDARAATLLQQRLQALRADTEAALRRGAGWAPSPARPAQPQSPAPTLRSSAASPALRGSPMLDGEAAPLRAGCVRGARPPPRGAETRRCEGGPGRAPLRRAPVVSAPRPQPGFKKAVLPAPPRPAPQSQAACGSHLSALFLRGLELGGGRQSPRDLAPGLRVPSAVGSQARSTPPHTHTRAHLQGCVRVPSQPCPGGQEAHA